MMKSKLFLRNSVKRGLLLNICIIVFLTSGCTSSTTPTYLREDISEAIEDICKNEYRIEIRVKLVGETLWIYIPVEDILVASDKPEKYIEKFEISENQGNFIAGQFRFDYQIKSIPDEEKVQEYKYNKSVLEKVNNVWKVLRRVIFSMERKEDTEPRFFCVITADIKNGIELKDMFYYLDLKKVSYEFISWTEYQHRNIQKVDLVPEAIGDKEGLHIDYKNIDFEEFIANQIRHRIKLKFQKPEVEKNADIDKEILKIVVYTLKTYGFKDFSAVELNNLLTQNKIILNQAAVWARPVE